MSTLIKITLLLLLIYAGLLYSKDADDMPTLQDGDIIFQTTIDSQTLPIAVATVSLYTHTGIIKKTTDGYSVYQAARKVVETPLSEWIGQGSLKRFAVYRHKQLSDRQKQVILSTAQAVLGTSYDIYFSFDNKTIYCSELPWLAYRRAGIALGTVQKVADLKIYNEAVKSLIQERWNGHPKCARGNLTFTQCYDLLLQAELITPVSISEDPNVEEVFSNYYWDGF